LCWACLPRVEPSQESHCRLGSYQSRLSKCLQLKEGSGCQYGSIRATQ
jgi:hypothetical protein